MINLFGTSSPYNQWSYLKVSCPHQGPWKDAAAPAELRQPAEEEVEFSSDSFVGSELEEEITGASGPPSSAAPRRKTHRAVRMIPLSMAGLTVAHRSLRSSTPKGTSKVRGTAAPRLLLQWGQRRPAPKPRRKRPRDWASCVGVDTVFWHVSKDWRRKGIPD